MKRIQFTKAHGARNDFLITWAHEAPEENRAAIARAICDRHTGVGADGWILLTPAPKGEHGAPAIQLYNSDGSEPEISGNGTRCAAAFLIDCGLAGNEVAIETGAGRKHLRLIERSGLRFMFEMNMGRPVCKELNKTLSLKNGDRKVTIIDVGNPQCVVFAQDLLFDWRAVGAEIERHPDFPNRTNVSFVRPIDRHSVEVRFFERGAGATMSSGTGSTGAAAAAILRGFAESPVRVLTEAGPLDLRWDNDIFLRGPAEIAAGGEFYMEDSE